MKLDDWLHDSGESVAALAARCGVHPTTVHRWKTGERCPGPSQLAALSRATMGQVTPADFGIAAPTPAGFAEAQSPLHAEAVALGIDAERVAAEALRKAIGDEKARRWAEENAEAIAAWNRYFETNDTPLAKYRAF